jgi:imidazolonepropionase-like amidohydrolase
MLGTLAESQWKTGFCLAILFLFVLQPTTCGQEDLPRPEGPPPANSSQPLDISATIEEEPATADRSDSESVSNAHAQPEPEVPNPAPTTAYIGAEVHTLESQGTLASAVVIVQAGKIVAIGDQHTEIPEHATRVDLTGYIVTPGLIDANSKLWLAADSLNASANDASLEVVDGINPYSEDWHEVARQGVTSIYIQPSTAGVMSGFGAVLSVAPLAGEPVVLKQLAGLQGSFGSPSSTNRARAQQYQRIKRLLESASDYAGKWKAYQEYQSQPAADSQPAESGTAKRNDGEAKPPKKPEVDPILEKLVKVLEGEIPLRFELNNSDEAAFLDKLLEEQKFARVQVIVSGITNPRSSLSGLVASNRPLVLGPWLDIERPNSGTGTDGDQPVQKIWSDNFASYSGSLAIASSGRSPRSSRLLRAHAASAIASGFDSQRVLRSVTVEAARLLGLEDTVGTLAVGKRADLVAFAGEPLDPRTPVRLVVIGGEVIHDDPAIEATAAADTRAAKAGKHLLPERLPTAYRLRSSQVLLDGKLQPAAITIRDGKFVEVAADAAADSTLREYDCGHSVITPGLFSAHAQLGINRLIDPRGLPDSSFVVAADCLVNNEVERQSLISGGLLRVALAPGNTNAIAGMVSVVRLSGADPIVQREGALKLVLTSAARSADSFPSSLGGQMQLVEQSLTGRLIDSKLFVPSQIADALNSRRTAAFQAAVGQTPRLTVVAASSDAEIRAALDLIEQHKLKAALLGPKQLLPFINRMKKLDVGLIVQSGEPETFQWFYDDLSSAAQAGISIAFAGENAEQLRLTAAMSGLPGELALNSLFTAPVEWGLEANTITSDGPADLVVWSGSPLHLGTQPLCVIVDGKQLHRR